MWNVLVQSYFYVNFFNPLEDNSTVNEKSLNKKTIEKLLNEILSTNRQENESRIEEFAEENDICRGEKLGRPVPESQSLFIRNCWLRTCSTMFFLTKCL